MSQLHPFSSPQTRLAVGFEVVFLDFLYFDNLWKLLGMCLFFLAPLLLKGGESKANWRDPCDPGWNSLGCKDPSPLSWESFKHFIDQQGKRHARKHKILTTPPPGLFHGFVYIHGSFGCIFPPFLQITLIKKKIFFKPLAFLPFIYFHHGTIRASSL